jgi:DNA-binding transcriptional ArsR family regulator
MGEMRMGDLARSTGMSEPNASIQLRALNARGLIKATRRALYVYYSAEPNAEVEYAVALLAVLRESYECMDPFSFIIRQATAYTHPRRIHIVATLEKGCMKSGQLSSETGISQQALGRHIAKLRARGIVERIDGRYGLMPQEHPLGAFLLAAASGKSIVD